MGENLSNFSSQFWNKKSNSLQNVSSFFSVITHNSSVGFQLMPFLLWTKRSHQSPTCKNWRGTDLCFWKRHEELSEFWSNTSKFQNLHFIGLFLAIVYNIWAKKNTGESCVIILKIDPNFEGKVTCGFINDLRNLFNFTGALKIIKNLHFERLFSPSYIILR